MKGLGSDRTRFLGTLYPMCIKAQKIRGIFQSRESVISFWDYFISWKTFRMILSHYDHRKQSPTVIFLVFRICLYMRVAMNWFTGICRRENPQKLKVCTMHIKRILKYLNKDIWRPLLYYIQDELKTMILSIYIHTSKLNIKATAENNLNEHI